MSNTIIANNVDAGGEAPDCTGQISSQGYNLVQNPAGCALIGGPGDITGQDPKLGPLTNNGGPTETRALLRGSPAIDAGNQPRPAAGATRVKRRTSAASPGRRTATQTASLRATSVRSSAAVHAWQGDWQVCAHVVPDGPCAGACDADSRRALRSVAKRTRASGRLLHGFRRLPVPGPASRW